MQGFRRSPLSHAYHINGGKMMANSGGVQMSLKTATSVFGLVFMGLSTSGGRAALADSDYFQPGNLLLSRALYDNNPNNVQAGFTQLPPNCTAATPCATAISNGTYPYVWNNDTVDASFGITAKIVLDQLTPSGVLVNSLEVPNSSQNGVPPTKDQMVTSFPSKSEIALNLSTDGSYLTFMGYLAPIDAIDISNS